MPRRAIQPGEQKGGFIILARVGGTSKHPKFEVQCVGCGAILVRSAGSLSDTKGCKKCQPGGSPRKYGDRRIADNPLYWIWTGMRRRCNPDNINEHTERWGGRGIRVCPEWESFEEFERWSMANGYEPGLTIDRVDNDDDYTPGNCEWVTRSVNSKRVRSLYRMVPITQIIGYPYDEPTYGDF